MLTQERADILSRILEEDPERAKELIAKEPEDAVQQINSLGYDFAVQELVDFGNAVRVAASSGELAEEDLASVSGGLVTVSIGIMIACGIGGFALGFVANKSW